ncbi:hypothetical protein HYZ98_01070 [Candidatus Peregrinibacteria bacterium]|nr:hypothetical protein [Candidatus Peregrinibacteria bacterium]
MEIADARTRSRQLNAQLMLKRQEERIRQLQKAENEFRMRNNAVLPLEFVEEFELCFLKIREEGSLISRTRRQKRVRVLWKAAQKMIRTLQIEPSEWFYHIHDVYDYFCNQQLSLSYSQGILKFANLWGFFISRKLVRPFLPVPVPKGYERQRILEAFYQKAKGRRRPSLPLAPEQLAKAAGKLNQANFNWLFLSVWFGLRPQEVDHQSLLVNTHHTNWRLRAIERYRLLSDEELAFSCPVSISTKDIKVIREKLASMIEEMGPIIDQSEPETLACLNIDWFIIPPQ